MMSEEEGPRCRFCGGLLGEGLKLKRAEPRGDLHVCWDCWDLVTAIIHDNVLEILGELSSDLQQGFDKLEGWTHKEERRETSQHGDAGIAQAE